MTRLTQVRYYKKQGRYLQCMRLRKSLYISGIWLLPALLVMIESLIFLPKALRHSSFPIYFIGFWTVRALLAPAIVFYTLKFWVEYNRIGRLFLLHLIGFLLFSALFWGLSYLVLYDTLYQNVFFGSIRTGTDLGVFSLIADNSLSTNIVVYVSTVAFCYIWEFFRRNAESSKKASELEKSLLISKLELLKGQLNTHFLFNTLHTISSLVVRNKNEEANKILVRLSDLLRFALKENKEQLIPLQKEIEILQLYLDIQQTRFNDRLDISIKYPDSLRNALVPALILQPIVENAVKYAVEPFKEKGMIEIDISHDKDILSVNIADNGQTPFHSINFDNGIGLQNTRERLQQLYNGRHVFSVIPNKISGTLVSFVLPLQFSTNGNIENTYSG
jgi:two-component system, LytTR family, sensor kinase